MTPRQAQNQKQPLRREEIARQAGVSAMTVTRALRGENIRPETRDRILALCDKLGYRANLAAQSLRLRKSWLVGLLVSTVKHEFWSRVIDTAERKLQQNGYHMVILQTGRYFAWDMIEFLLSRNVDGILQAAPCTDAVYRRLVTTNLRTVLLNTETASVNLPQVGVDHRGGAELAMDYLLQNGHRQIAHLRGPAGQFSADQRWEGYRACLTAAGIAVDSRLVVEQDFHYDGGAEGARELLRRQVPFTAIFAANDYMAIGAMHALNHAGLRVPDEVSVIGFSGDSVGQYSLPPLTTIFEPAEEITEQALDLLLQPDTATIRPQKIVIPCQLLVRNSCGPCPG